MARSTASKTDETGDTAEGTAEGTGEGAKRTRHMPKYAVEAVDELPEEIAHGRSRLYFDLMTPAFENPGKLFRIAEFQTPNGAANAKRELENGRRDKPDGKWDIKAVKVLNPDNPAGQRHSKLYVTFLGPE